MKEIAKDVYYVGVDDREIQFFEGMYKVPCGVTYNSYVIKDVNIAVMDSVDAHFEEEWLANIERVTQGSAPDYLIVQHMEPDHSACVAAFAKKYPQAKMVNNDSTTSTTLLINLVKNMTYSSLNAAISSVSMIICFHSFDQFFFCKIGPGCLGKIELRVGQLPEKKI